MKVAEKWSHPYVDLKFFIDASRKTDGDPKCYLSRERRCLFCCWEGNNEMKGPKRRGMEEDKEGFSFATLQEG
ncbi:hypothetical protein RRG08_053920 [Elysia crispata]|uniref:Uncharacterized protein n=1 Tax=Elysia crispata TaxID=231223 RepID=A0AAE1AP35_9GAST|nr:hypothetical protein RRG08_053920 [Elysia crispata]